MNRLRTVLLFCVFWVGAYLLEQASRRWYHLPSEPPPMSVPYAKRLAEQRQRFTSERRYPPFELDDYRGSVVVVSAGRPGSEETERWLGHLRDLWREGLPEGVEVVWLGVGGEPEEVAEVARRLALPFGWFADPVGATASRLNHRLNPTLYLVGKWGAVRYAGDLQPAKLTRMLAMLTKEQAGGDRQFFTSRGVDEGHLAPEFNLIDLEGKPVSLSQLRASAILVHVLFAGADLRSGAKATASLNRLVNSLGPGRLSAGVIYSLVNPKALGKRSKRYLRRSGRVHVLIDESGEVARTYRLGRPPLWLVIGTRGIIRYRGDSGKTAAATVTGMLRRPSRPRTPGPALLPP